MSEFTENRASEAFEQSGGNEVVLTWAAANRMLPLVRHIVADVLECQRRLGRLQPEKDRLDRQRRTLSWPERARRYELQETLTGDEQHLQEVLGELGNLGVALLDRDTGQVGFPTMVNKRRAYFSWVPGEEKLSHWHYAGDNERHPVPTGWTRTETSRRSRS